MMKHLSRFRFAINIAFCLTMLFSISTNAAFGGDKKIILTTGDLKQDYDIISPSYNYADVTPGLFSDPYIEPSQKLFNLMIKDAQDQGGDAVIGLRIDIQNLSEGHAGKILMYGTIVKFKSADNAPKDTSTKSDKKTP